MQFEDDTLNERLSELQTVIDRNGTRFIWNVANIIAQDFQIKSDKFNSCLASDIQSLGGLAIG